MQKRNGKIQYSASDLMAFLECQHLTSLNLIDLDTPLPRSAPDEQNELIRDKGFAHEADYLESLRAAGLSIVELSSERDSMSNINKTREAMAAGAEVIFQAALSDGTFVGHVDFLRRVEVPSALASWSYEVSDTKLARRTKPKFMIQLVHYSNLLTATQGSAPQFMHLVLGDRTESSFRVEDYRYYYERLRKRFDEFLAEAPRTVAEKCDHCTLCDWRERCAEEWEVKDHLNRVANISKIQIKRFQNSGVSTLAQLGSLGINVEIPKIQVTTLARLRSQAALQLKKRETGENQIEILPQDQEAHLGFDRLPTPNVGDIYFDMEGDPLHEDGLEYLFGVYLKEESGWSFKDFWAHDRKQEKVAFSAFMDFVTERLRRYPAAHIYHYAAYEPTALKRLMSLHGTRESEIDQLLRDGRFVDLFQVVREAIRVSEPRYSIKNLETFYMPPREGEVTSAGASIVYYENWRRSQDDALLTKIRDYNKDDCISTKLLHDWLVKLAPANDSKAFDHQLPVAQAAKSDKVALHEARIAEYEVKLLDGIDVEGDNPSEDERLRMLLFQLLDFHRRADKPAWWALYARRDLSMEELIDDAECIADLRLLKVTPALNGKGASLALYSYPEQEFKLREGENCLRTDTSSRLGSIDSIKDDERLIGIKISPKYEIPEAISICSGGPIPSDSLRDALFRLVDGYLDGGKYAAPLGFLMRQAPLIRMHSQGMPIIGAGTPALPQMVHAVENLDASHLFIQGPPGAGKTYTGSHLILALIAKGFRVGVTSNSHKAIHNLLHAVEQRAHEHKQSFKGCYKATSQTNGSTFEGDFIECVDKNDEVFEAITTPHVKLIAGTAWLFCDEAFDQMLDYLFVDEAGQVATANLVAMATSAKNIVLLGDQMQLGQPIQGVHPGDSGLSSLDFLLQGKATIPPDRGIFLETTWRMHPDICQFISDAVYEGRLLPEAKNQQQHLILNSSAHKALLPTGLSYVPAIHDACSQSSEEEAEIVKTLFLSLLDQSFIDRDAKEHRMTMSEILVVAPYNVQVNLLRKVLPEGARVGTVDKFQGQEGQVVIVSMTTSNAETMPRHMEFLFSKNRLNVAISRARCLALLVASPRLAEIKCATVDQMGLVNFLCKATQPNTILH
ncbi:MAG: TM0106 family RecB-like putative nuclease [Rhodocyclaceae bacterium]|nr:TM0106 family RecB-like putative nuclease [Rhodocyclaceae bacterium]MCA3060334.1 TM0106 family RecB-like putative nuclease [Rhodocyclaceae bacterium]MCA3081276.1 TM0106 family RecB-like putative nuclease [Rhodocyclaceae bacterium]